MTGRTAVVVMAYGTPETPADVEAYYTHIRRGRAPTSEQLADLVRRYQAIGGTSPLATRTKAQVARLQAALDERAEGRFQTFIGLKHAAPFIEEAAAALVAQGFVRAVGLVLAPHYSTLSVGEYLRRAADAFGAFGAVGPGIEFTAVESWHLEPAYLDFLARATIEARAELPARTKTVFTAHSLPARILQAGDPYPEQLRQSAAAVAERVGLQDGTWTQAWQSAGRTPEPWLGPDILEVIRDLRDCDGLLVVAQGFVADHLEVLYDLDIEARAAAEAAGLAFARTRSLNDDAAVFAALADRVVAAAS